MKSLYNYENFIHLYIKYGMVKQMFVFQPISKIDLSHVSDPHFWTPHLAILRLSDGCLN